MLDISNSWNCQQIWESAFFLCHHWLRWNQLSLWSRKNESHGSLEIHVRHYQGLYQNGHNNWDKEKVKVKQKWVWPIISFFNIAYRKNSPFLEVNHSRQAMLEDWVSIENCLSSKWGLTLSSVQSGTVHWKLDQSFPLYQTGGWIKGKNGIWVPHWSDYPIIADALLEIIRCGCKKHCSGNCTFCQYGLPCSPLCACYLLGCSR